MRWIRLHRKSGVAGAMQGLVRLRLTGCAHALQGQAWRTLTASRELFRGPDSEVPAAPLFLLSAVIDAHKSPRSALGGQGPAQAPPSLQPAFLGSALTSPNTISSRLSSVTHPAPGFPKRDCVPLLFGTLPCAALSTSEVDVIKEALHPAKEQTGIGGEAKSSQRGPKYTVWKVTQDGRKSTEEIEPDELGLPPRDLDILSSVTFTPHRAQIGARNGKLLVRMENLRALIGPDHVIFFGGRFARSASLCAELASSFLQQHPQGESPFPFQLRVLECTLRETRTYFVHKVAKLKMVAETMLEDLASDISTAGLHLRLLPLKRTMTEVDNDVRETYEALTEVMENEDLLTDLCRTAEQSAQGTEGTKEQSLESRLGDRKRKTTAMLLTYQREVQDVGSALKELRENCDSAQAVWELGLDSTRNRIIKMNLYIGMATLSASCAQLPAAFFGMNVPSGLEEAGGLFPLITAGACGASLALFAYCLYWYKFRPQRKHQRRLQDISALRDLLHHIDDLDDIIRRGIGQRGHMNRDEFADILRQHPATAQLGKGSVALIFRMLDHNKNRSIDVGEFTRALDGRLPTQNNQQFQ